MNRSVFARIWTKILCPSMLVTAMLLIPLGASAQQYTAAHKVRRGFANTTLGILAIPGQMTQKTREDGYAVGLPLGFVQGLAWFVVTEVTGIWEILTCPFEFPPRFRPIIKPEHPWDSFENGNPGAGRP